MRAVLYCRVSTTEQTRNLSLATQETACREYAARHGYTVDEVFIDAGESAKTTDRPEFRRLLEHCRKQRGRVHAVIVYALTRFSRNSTDHHTIAALLRGFGTSIRSVTEPIDDSPSGRFMEGILAAVAQFDNDVKSERVVAGMRAAIARGRWVWVAPLGYVNGNTRRGPSLLPDQDRAPLVRAAFELCANGVTGQTLLKRLAVLGLRTKQQRPLTWSRLYVMLRHPVYAGYVRSIPWQTEQRGDFEQLVTEDLFARVQIQLNRPTRAETTRADRGEFPLRRFVRCGGCQKLLTGSASTGRNRRAYPFYHCVRGCTRVKTTVLEDAFVTLMETLKPRRPYWDVLRTAVLDVARDQKQDAARTHAQLRRRVDQIDGQLARVDAAFLYDRTIDADTYRQHRDELRANLAIARLEVTEAATSELDIEGMLAFAEQALTNAASLWTTAASTDRRVQIQQTFFPLGLTWKDGQFFEPRNILQFYQLEGISETDPVWRPTNEAVGNTVLAWLQHMQQLAA